MIRIIGKFENILCLLRKAIDAGYGELPAVYSIKFYLERN